MYLGTVSVTWNQTQTGVFSAQAELEFEEPEHQERSVVQIATLQTSFSLGSSSAACRFGHLQII